MRRFIVVATVSLAGVLTLSGCMWQFASGSGLVPPTGTQFLSGSVTGTPITGRFEGVLTAFAPTPDPNCSDMTLLVTLTDAAGNTVTKEETGLWCLGQFTGQYTVTGGTGIYQGATGSGTSTIQITPINRFQFTFTAQEIGTFEVPGTASATSGRKTFKMRGTLKSGGRLKVNG